MTTKPDDKVLGLLVARAAISLIEAQRAPDKDKALDALSNWAVDRGVPFIQVVSMMVMMFDAVRGVIESKLGFDVLLSFQDSVKIVEAELAAQGVPIPS